MKKSSINLLYVIFSIMLLAVSVTLISCAKKTEYGQKTTISADSPKLQVKDILSSEQYVDKEVVLEGRITLECGSGCWFNLEDGTGKVYVDLLPSNFAIPQWVGKTVIAQGKVIKEKGDIKLIGKSVKQK
jgi:hypothetical protein